MNIEIPWQSIRTVTQYGGILASGIAGTIGILVKVTDDSGAITRGGKWLLCITILGAVAAICSQVADDVVKQSEEDRLLVKASATLDGIERLLMQVRDVGVSAQITTPLSKQREIYPELAWRDTINRGEASMGVSLLPDGVFPSHRILTGGTDLVLARVVVSPDSACHPLNSKGVYLRPFMSSLGIRVAVRRAPLTPAANVAEIGEPDWTFVTQPTPRQIEVDLNDDLLVQTYCGQPEPSLESNAGGVRSLSDLAGALVSMRPTLLQPPGQYGGERSRYTFEVDGLLRRSRIDPQTVVLVVNGLLSCVE